MQLYCDDVEFFSNPERIILTVKLRRLKTTEFQELNLAKECLQNGKYDQN